MLIVSFAVLFYFLKPTSMEKAVAQQLDDIQKSPMASTRAATILRQDAAASNTLTEELDITGSSVPHPR